MFSLHLPLLAALCVGALAGRNKYAAITTAPIYLPHYNEESWSLVRGSIIGLVGEIHILNFMLEHPS